MKSLKAALTGSRKLPPARKRRRGRASRMASLLIPIESLFLMTARQYVSLVAQTGGVATDEEPHVERLMALGIDAQRWKAVLKETMKLFGTAVGQRGEPAEGGPAARLAAGDQPDHVYQA